MRVLKCLSLSCDASRRREAPAIEYDLFVHIRCDRYDILHLVANEISQMFEDLVN